MDNTNLSGKGQSVLPFGPFFEGADRSQTVRKIHRWSTLPFGSRIFADQRASAYRRQRRSAV